MTNKEKIALQDAKFAEAPRGYEGEGGTRYFCPNCHKRTSKDYGWCIKCGQKLKFPKIKKNADNKWDLFYED